MASAQSSPRVEQLAVTAEGKRLAQSNGDEAAWRRWGPYVAARQWGTVREDYSADGDAWNFFGFDDAHRRACRWGEDGLGGVCDRYGLFNLALALWNGEDDRLKERPFGLTNAQGNHGEDVKEYYWALDATPTHSWAQWLYRYPQAAYPYQDLIDTNAGRGLDQLEYELLDTGLLAEDRLFDVTITHAKQSAGDLVMVVEATNRGDRPAPLDLIPQGWFRNTWAWGRDDRRPSMTQLAEGPDPVVRLKHAWLGTHLLQAEGEPEVLWCNNETNTAELWGTAGDPHPKNAIDRAVVHGDRSLLGQGGGTKVGFRYHFDEVAPGQSVTVRLRLTVVPGDQDANGSGLFEGGFLGMDNISLFDRSGQVPPGWELEQSDGTTWVAFLASCLLRMTEELARRDDAWDEMAATMLDRFLSIADAMEAFGPDRVSLWDDQDGFFHDVLVGDQGQVEPLRVRSMVGLLPLLAVGNSPHWADAELPNLARRLRWIKRHRPDRYRHLVTAQGESRYTVSLVNGERLPRILARLPDEDEFWSPHGVRSLSASYRPSDGGAG